jgi:hypothetical protein
MVDNGGIHDGAMGFETSPESGKGLVPLPAVSTIVLKDYTSHSVSSTLKSGKNDHLSAAEQAANPDTSITIGYLI